MFSIPEALKMESSLLSLDLLGFVRCRAVSQSGEFDVGGLQRNASVRLDAAI